MAEPSGFTVQPSRLPKEPLIAAALIVIVSVTLAVGGIVYKTRDSIQRDKVEFLADSNQKQVAPLRRVIQLRLAQDKARLIQFAATRSALGPGRSRVFGDFALVSLLTPASGGQWGLSWIEKGPLYSQLQSAQAMVTSDQEIALLKSLPYDRIREGDIYWQRLSDSSGRPIWALAVSVETQASANAPTNPSATTLPEGTDYQSVQVGTGGRAVVVGFFGRNPLLSATEDFIGSTSTAFVIDSRGYAATHSNKTMVGSMLKDDPSVKEIFSARSSAGATRYQSPQGPKIFSAFEQVDRANLYVVMSTPETVTASTGASFGRTAVTTGGFALIVGLFLVFAWGAKLLPRTGGTPLQPMSAGDGGIRFETDPDTGSFSRLTPTGEIGRPNAARAGVPGMDNTPLELPAEFRGKAGAVGRPMSHSSELANNALVAQAQDRAAFVGRFVQGLERGMKEPLLAAMAHVQLVKVKAGDTPSAETMTEIAEHVTAVDRDLRRAKEMIDELGQLSSQAGTPTATERADLNRLVTSVIDSNKATLDQDGISLKVDATSVPLVRGREEPVRKVLNELLKNAHRALKSRSNKVIHVRLSDTGDTVKLSVEDNGVGMDRETRTQAFDPFFHNFDAADARGLGLAMVRSIVHAHGGTCELSSTPGDGTVVTLNWPVLASEREAFSTRPVKVEMVDAGEHTAQTFSLDLGEEGANVLGGKTPLSPEFAGSLPPSPRFGADEIAEDLNSDGPDEGDEKWGFSQPSASPALGQPASVSAHETSASDPDKTEAVKIRPVRRG